MKSNMIILITRNQLDTCHVRFVIFLALQNVLRVANDGFSSPIHGKYIYRHRYRFRSISIYSCYHCTFLLFCMSFKQKKKKSNIIVSELHWLDSEFHKALRGMGTTSALPMISPVVSSLQIIVPCPPKRIWLEAQSPWSCAFHRCSVTVVRDNENVS